MPYFNHLCYLVAAIHIVLSDAIEEVDLLNADKFLKTFYSQYAELYGPHFGCQKSILNGLYH